MVAFFSSREATDGTVSLPAGWGERVNNRGTGGLVAAWTRPWQTGDAAPTFTLGGHATGVSGDSAIAVIHLVRPTAGKQLQFVGASTPSHNAASSTTVGPIDGDTLSVAVDGIVLVLGQHRETAASFTDLTGDGLTWIQTSFLSNTSGADNSQEIDHALSNNVAITDKSYTVNTSGGSSTGAGFMLFLSEVDPPSAPPAVVEWPNPQRARRSVDALTHLQWITYRLPVIRAPLVTRYREVSRAVAIASQIHQVPPAAQEAPAVAPFLTPNWPLPSRRRFPVELLTWTEQPPLVVDVIYGAPGEAPGFEWPTPPARRTPNLYGTWVENLLQRTLAPAPGVPVRPVEWTLPRRAARPVELLSWAANLLESTLAPAPQDTPFRHNDWKNPAARERRNFDARLGGVVDAGDPRSARVLDLPGRAVHPIGLRTWSINLLEGTLSIAPANPLVPVDMPLPGLAQHPLGLRTWAVNLLQGTLTPGDPKRPFDWPLPGRAQHPIGLHTWTTNLLQSTLQPADPVIAKDWPLPTRRVPAPPTWTQNLLQGTLFPGDPIRGVTAPNPLRPRRAIDLLTWSQLPLPGNIPVDAPPVFGWGARGRIGGAGRDPWGRIGTEVAPDVFGSIGTAVAIDPTKRIGSEDA